MEHGGELPEVKDEEIVIVQCSIVICHLRWRFAQTFLTDAAPKAHPKMTNDN